MMYNSDKTSKKGESREIYGPDNSEFDDPLHEESQDRGS